MEEFVAGKVGDFVLEKFRLNNFGWLTYYKKPDRPRSTVGQILLSIFLVIAPYADFVINTLQYVKNT